MYLEILGESSLTKGKRDRLKSKTFGIPETRSYPMPDREHVKYAIRMFDRCSPDRKDELAGNILRFIRKYDMADEVEVGRDNGFYRYWKDHGR